MDSYDVRRSEVADLLILLKPWAVIGARLHLPEIRQDCCRRLGIKLDLPRTTPRTIDLADMKPELRKLPYDPFSIYFKPLLAAEVTIAEVEVGDAHPPLEAGRDLLALALDQGYCGTVKFGNRIRPGMHSPICIKFCLKETSVEVQVFENDKDHANELNFPQITSYLLDRALQLAA